MTLTSKVDRTGGEIDWPHWAERTPPSRRVDTKKFSVTLAAAINDIETDLEQRIGVDDWRLSTAAPHRKKDGRPYADADPDDPGAVVRWTMDGDQYAVAADEYTDVRDNVRAIGLYIREKRKMSKRPIKTGRSEFATAQLPSGDEDAIVVGEPSKEPHEILEVDPDASDEVVQAAFRARVKEDHPDSGGGKHTIQELKEAREAMLDG